MPSERIQRQINRLLDEAELAMARLEWEIVMQRAQAVLALDSGNDDARSYFEAAQRATGSQATAPPPLSPPDSNLLPVQPTAFVQGRYQVKKFLGEGGKKKVYLAHDTVLDRDVAFALIKTEELDDTTRSRILREAQVMARLSDHPNIMQVFDMGQEAGQPYMVLPLMPGGDVEGLIRKAQDHRLSVDRALEIAKQVGLGLEFAHSKGVVHRDLKPGNVWLTQDGTAKIGDFGLALPLDQSRLTMEGMMVGTVAYMPPEQALGSEVTAKADLYSLGAMLYELVTGRPPFLGDSTVAIIGQHINTAPVAPTWHNAKCPRALDALIMRLLAKDPKERPESASDVLKALDGVGASVSGEAPVKEQANVLDSLAGGVFVGRQREMGELKAVLEDTLSGKGRLVMLVGEPGIGKTRTAQELATYAGLRSAQVLWGRCYESQGVPPYWPWVQAIRSYVREHAPQELHSEMGSGAANIAEVVSDVKERLPDLKPPPPIESAEASRFRLFDSISSFLKTASRKQPLLLILDDLHWADKPSLLLLEFVARELAGARLLLIGTYRDVELNRQHPLAETLGELTRERLFQRVLLRGLSQEDVARFMEVTTGAKPPSGLVRAVFAQTEGNPLFVTEVVRLLAQEGELTPERISKHDSGSVRIPEGVREVIGRRLNRLTQRCNEVLTVAAVIGREFALNQLLRLMNPSTSSGQAMPELPAEQRISEDRLLETVEEGLAAKVIEELPHAAGQYRFTHALIQETLIGELSLTRRVRLHARIAEALEALYGAYAEAHASELAHHFAEAESVLGKEKLVKYSLLAGEKALALYAWEESLAHFQRGLAAKEGQAQAIDRETADLLFGLGRAQIGMFNYIRERGREAVANLSRAFDYYSSTGNLAKALAIGEFNIPVMAGQPIGATELKAKALALAPPDSLEAGRILPTYLWHLGLSNGDREGAQRAFEQALAIAQRAGDKSIEMRALAYSSAIDGQNTDNVKGIEKGLQALKLAPEVNEPFAEVIAHFWLSNSLTSLGDLDAAGEHARAMLDLAERKVRDRYWLAYALSNNLRFCQLRGEWAPARSFSERVLDMSPSHPATLGARARLEYELGNFEQGRVYLERLVEVMRLAPPGGNVPNAVGVSTIPWLGRISGLAEHLEFAERTARSILNSTVGRNNELSARAGLTLIAVLRRDVREADQHYPALQTRRGTRIGQSGIEIDYLLGLIDQCAGRADQGAQNFETAIAFHRKGGARPDLAWALCDYADLLLERNATGGSTSSPRTGAEASSPRTEFKSVRPEPVEGRPGAGDQERANALLNEALAISRELGMRPLMERVLSRRKVLKA